ncbi:MAG TPA: glutamate formimidoyltransferase [Longimicrobiales bacterium]|nr:glutamate formimidoyltransferase [Longimicrobiales bacterium]
MVKVLEAVPNFSEGRDLAKVRALVDVVARAGVEVLDWSADGDHHRSVITYIGDPGEVEAASLDAARLALEQIDLRSHRGVHPRVGALDVLPFVPLHGLTMSDAVGSARRVGAELGRMGIPVFYYGWASSPPGRGLAELRRGGFEAWAAGFPPAHRPDEPAGASAPHATAGFTCVGAREVLLAWNVFLADVDLPAARAVARKIRERDGGFRGLRALGLHLPHGNRVQISMNLEDPVGTSPLDVLAAIEAEVVERGGRIVETEVIGMVPDTLVHPSPVNRLVLPDLGPARVLSHRVAQHVRARTLGRTEISESAE